MSDAPETICAWAFWRGGSYFCRHNANEVEFDPTNYRRDDLPPTQAQIMADPRVITLVDALEKLRLDAWGHEYAYESAFHAYVYDTITDALAQLKDPKP